METKEQILERVNAMGGGKFPLYEDAFWVHETYATIFPGLMGVYSRLRTKEEYKSDIGEQPDAAKLEAWRLRGMELSILSREYFHYPLKELNDLNDIYSLELKKMLEIEREEYDNVSHGYEKLYAIGR